MDSPYNVALLHGAGYAGREIIRWLASHPAVKLTAVTSRTYAGQPVGAIYRDLAGLTDLVYRAPDAVEFHAFDAVLIAAEHGKSASLVAKMVEDGYAGAIVDLSADFRLEQPDQYQEWYGFEHPSPDLLSSFTYGLVEGPQRDSTQTSRFIANPGCFATAIGLGLWPVTHKLPDCSVAVTALTGASGSGARAKATTHFPDRDGNVRAYKVLSHQHLPEILQSVGKELDLSFVPASGPWTRGIWGTAQIRVPQHINAEDVKSWYNQAYSNQPLVRCYAGTLPEQRHVAYSPFCDIGWVLKDHHLVIGFTIDNLLKGAATQAIQNLNRILGLDPTCGLLPQQFLQPSPL